MSGTPLPSPSTTELARIHEEALRTERERALDRLQHLEQALDEAEASLGQRERALDRRHERAESRRRAIEVVRTETSRLRVECDATRAERTVLLERIAQCTHDAAREETAAGLVEQLRIDVQRRRARQQEELESRAADEARRLLAIAAQRLEGEAHLERFANTIAMPEGTLANSLATEDHELARALHDELATHVSHAGSGEHHGLAIHCEDPVAREAARRLLRQLAHRPTTDVAGLRTLARTVKSELEREIENSGRRAARLAGQADLAPELVTLLGKLKYRASYSQNQWSHSLEVAQLGALLATELGLDAAQAKRAGLLHDVGKAITHEREGGHALLGAEVVRRCGEHEAVGNAVAAHHNDEPPSSPIAHLVAAADALSGARPGARRESATQYLERVRQIREVATRSPVVLRVDVMHAGREVRVIVAGAHRGDALPEGIHPTAAALDDTELHPLAEDIARTLEDEVAFAGQIRVTVIRETHAYALAR